jgi:hypothetical protein
LSNSAALTRDLMAGAKIGEVNKVMDNYAGLSRRFGPHVLQVFTTRERVCERVQVGVETVSRPDPEALALVRTVETVEPIYEWRCGPLLEVQS